MNRYQRKSPGGEPVGKRSGRNKPKVDQFWSLAERAGIEREIREGVQMEAPDLFAVVQLNSSLRTWWVTAWGLRFLDYTQVIGVQGERFTCETTDYARWHYDVGDGIRSAVVDVNPEEEPIDLASLDAGDIAAPGES